MKQFLIFASVVVCLSLSSCQCDSPPPIGPVEDESSAAIVIVDAEMPRLHLS